jgi:hypothetical protein
MEDIFLLSKKLGKMIHGILGFHLLKNFKVKIDYVSQKLTICRAETKRYAKEKNWQTLPIELIKEKPYLITTVVFSDEEKREMKLLMDSGAGHALMLSYLQKKKWLDSLPTAYLGRGLNGDLHGKIGYVDHFDLGKTPFNQVSSSFPDSLSLGLSYNYEESQGSIGAEMMRRFDWIIDYSHQKVSFRPNKNLHEKFNYNMSGLEISKPFVNLPVFLVEEVREKSAAALAGVRPGDQIVNFNGKTGSQLSMNLFYKTFHRQDGEKIKMTVIRQGVKIKILFLLKN